MTRRRFTFVATTSSFKLQRLGQIMEPDSGNPIEVEGVLNPAAIRGLDGELCLFPRLNAADAEERRGIVPNVVFLTGFDRRDDLGLPDRFDVYYGMADSRIRVARLDLPETLPYGEVADKPEKQKK